MHFVSIVAETHLERPTRITVDYLNDDGAVEQSNFHDYPLIRLVDTPKIDVTVLESGEKPGGVGEEAVGPVAPAVVNALFAASGRRIRQLPLSKAGFTLA
ncbi:MAG: hypothetical protein ACLPV8_05270 [Steroidobacteraceae bacterium]